MVHLLWLGWVWWGEHWLRVQAIATPIGSVLVTLWLSQAESVGWWWNSQSEFEIAARFASGGILFYTASIAALESGVWLMVLGLQLYRKFEQDRGKRQRELRILGAAMWREAERISSQSGEPTEEIFKRLNAENWQPPES